MHADTTVSRGIRRPRMGTGKHRAPACIAALLLGAACLPGAVRADKTVAETQPASASGRVEIDNMAGTLTVTGWDHPEVSVTGTICDECALKLEHEGERTVVHVEYPENRGRRPLHERESALTVKVPEGSAVSTSTVSANTDVSGIRGDVSLETVSGDIAVRGEPERIEAQVVSGKVEILAQTGRVQVESVSGDVTLQGPGGELEASNVSGDIRVEGGTFNSVEASTVSGDILFDGALEKDARCEMSSHSGDLEMRAPEGLSAEFHVQSFSGSIRSDFGPKPQRTSRHGPGREMEFSLGSASAQVDLSTFSGDVRIVPK
jgi:hypothetical protein